MSGWTGTSSKGSALSSWKSSPCRHCGSAPKEPGRGKRYCIPCRDLLSLSVSERDRETRRIKAEVRRREGGVVKRKLSKNAPAGQKWCPSCQRYLSTGAFPKSRGKHGGLQAYCKPCYAEILHERNLRKNFGVTTEEYDAILTHQGGVCAICGTAPRKKRLAVDHDHKTGKIRGLLCTQCNHRVLGGAKDDVNILRGAVKYLEKNPSDSVFPEDKIIPS